MTTTAIDHEFKDDDILGCVRSDSKDYVQLHISVIADCYGADTEEGDILIYKRDVIALAKALGVTPKDLEGE
jgi:hypothetical protein